MVVKEMASEFLNKKWSPHLKVESIVVCMVLQQQECVATLNFNPIKLLSCFLWFTLEQKVIVLRPHFHLFSQECGTSK